MFRFHKNTVSKYFFALCFSFLVFWQTVCLKCVSHWLALSHDHMNWKVVKDKLEFLKLLPGWLDFMWVIITGELIVWPIRKALPNIYDPFFLTPLCLNSSLLNPHGNLPNWGQTARYWTNIFTSTSWTLKNALLDSGQIIVYPCQQLTD